MLFRSYHIWCDIRDTSKDVEFCSAIDAYLGHLKKLGHIESFTVTRRKFGFGPSELGDFHITIRVHDLGKLDDAFHLVASRSGEVERLHGPVWSVAINLKTALYRDFPGLERSK